jgi:hypothetical protein
MARCGFGHQQLRQPIPLSLRALFGRIAMGKPHIVRCPPSLFCRCLRPSAALTELRVAIRSAMVPPPAQNHQCLGCCDAHSTSEIGVEADSPMPEFAPVIATNRLSVTQIPVFPLSGTGIETETANARQSVRLSPSAPRRLGSRCHSSPPWPSRSRRRSTCRAQREWCHSTAVPIAVEPAPSPCA